jgi:hypothetical protein
MIERTAEMERLMCAALAAATPGRHHAAVRAGLDAVLALVEQDLRVPPQKILDEINRGRSAGSRESDDRLRAALWSCSTFSLGDLHDALRAAGFVHVGDLPSPATGSNPSQGGE